MKKLLSVALMALAPMAMAQDVVEKSGAYVGIGSTGTAVEIEGADDDAAVGSISLKLGFAFNENVALELRIMGESDWDDIGYNTDVRLDSGIATYMRFSMGNENFDPYVLLGYASLEGTSRHPYYGSETSDDSGVAFGFGANWKINDLISITGDWTVPIEDVVQFNLGLDFKF